MSMLTELSFMSELYQTDICINRNIQKVPLNQCLYEWLMAYIVVTVHETGM